MEKWFDNYLDRARVRFVGLAVLAVGLVLLIVTFATSDRGRTFFGPALGADFSGFYTAGSILNSAEDDRLYDPQSYDQIRHDILPNLEENERLAFLHPPFVAVLFRPLALLPYEAAFGLWLVLSAGLYLSGLALVWMLRTNLPSAESPMVLLLAVSFEPFVMECWLGGQLSALAFFCVGLAFFCQERERPFRTGLALGLLAYKPTLLILLGPMVLVGRRWRVLAGIAVTVSALVGASYLLVGERVCRGSLDALSGFLRSRTTGAEQVPAEQIVPVRLTKYVDVNAFVRLLPGLPPLARVFIAVAIGIAALWFLLPLWWRWQPNGDAYRRLVWAATVTWTLVLNLYVGIYDATLAVFAALVAADVLWRPAAAKGEELPRGFRVLLVLLYLVPWFAQPLATATGVQAMTLVLMAVGAYLLATSRRADLPPNRT